MNTETRCLIILGLSCIICQNACAPAMATPADQTSFFTSTTLEMEGIGSCPPRIENRPISRAERETNAIRFAESDALRRAAMKISKVLVGWTRQGRIQLSRRTLDDQFLHEVEDIVFDHFERIGNPNIKTFDDGSVRAEVKIRCTIHPVVQSVVVPKMRFKLSFNRAVSRDVIEPLVNQLPRRGRLIIEPFQELASRRFTTDQRLAVEMFRAQLMEQLLANQFDVKICNRNSGDWQVIERELGFMTQMVAQGRAASNTDLVQRILGGTTLVTSELAFLQNNTLFAVIRVTDFKSGELYVVNAFLPNPISSIQ
jgi:hypothetical protein